MNLDLKESEHVGEEKFGHLITALMCMFEELDDIQEEKDSEKEAKKKWKEIEEYLGSYIEGIVEQEKKKISNTF